ncbi:MAG: outer membrane protein assembly factor BamA [Brevundimonas sp.]|uniref:Outer membrane protein assembly factor BamA n=1 Tax=Brevundimonas albigilva TaxID=1312364 RepID=A0ABY4SR39_9CAUL|nr:MULTISPECIES: outer membrane protein assembly factor BamA [Brevundimonas]MCV0413610.1 outer membrane protein assembly factor BamA [Brevundimonas sp.]PZU53124.1 MAG: outer membrane protein assembly factor BamA [Brevundimonas sp.]UQV18476.1 outer membrane protein assembly factor BamA [Brevundimonas albigilva]URI16708.1 outer membrane protein assembly factor BamA [Brevundimonas albigilva]
MIDMKTRAAARLSARSSLMALFVAAGLGAPAMAQTAPATAPAQPAAEQPPRVEIAAPESLVVNRIVVQGAQRIDQTTVLSYLPIRPGDTVDAATLDVAVRTLSRTGLFANVQLGVQNGDLIVQIVENPIINQVVFEGNSAVSQDKLTEEVTLKPRGIYTRAKVQEDVGAIVELYRLQGRISATVTPKLVQLEQNRVDVIFEINEGRQTGISAINILGNEAYSDRDIRGVMVTEKSTWWKFFSNNDNYDPNRLEYDQEQLRKFYTNRGYYDFRIVSSVAELQPDDQAFQISLTMDEGDRYNFGEVNVVTENDRLNADFLKALVPIRSGDLYESDKIESAVDALTFAAGSAGYAFVEINPTYRANPDTDTVDVTFNVSEGQRVYVDRINVVGNTRTIDPVIRRELMLTEGDAFNRALMERSRNNLRALGFFKDVTVQEERGSAPDRSVINVNVQEQPTGELSVGAGFSSVDSFTVNLGISERNFRGRGQNVVARLEWGSLRQQVDFRFTEPKFLGRDLRAGFDLFHSRYDLSEYSSYDYRSTGGGLRLSYPLNGYTLFSTRYFLKSDEIIVPSGYCTSGGFGSSALCDQVGSYLNSSVGYTLQVNRTNDPVRPTRGWAGSLRQDFAGLGGDVNYIRTEADASYYYGITPNWIVSLQGSTGYVSGWNGDPIRINDRFFKGGNSFRGFETAGMGPRDLDTTDALGGNFYAIGTVELTLPNYLPEQYGIKTSLFADFGTLGVLDDRYKLTSTGTVDPTIADELSLRASAGLSIHWRSPMGPIRFDISKVLAKEDYDKTESFRFSTSTQF